MSTPETGRRSGLTTLFWVAATITALAVAMGSLVCATDSSHACPNWPGCYVGQIGPEAALHPWIEFSHRVVAVSTGPLLLITALVALRQRNRTVWTAVLPWVALAGAVTAGVFGMMVIRWGLSKTQAAADLFASLVAMVAISAAASALAAAPANGQAPARWSTNLTARLAWASVAIFIVVHISGIYAAGDGSLTRCVGCPAWTIVDIDGPVWLQVTRIVLAIGAILLALAAVASAFRDQSRRQAGIDPTPRPDLRIIGVLAVVFLAIELAMGYALLAHGISDFRAGTHAVAMGGLLWMVTLLATRSSFVPASHVEPAEQVAAHEYAASTR